MFITYIISSHRKKQSSSISVSVDGAWQKRGSGRSYDSLTGNIIQLWSLHDYHMVWYSKKKLLGQMYYLYHTCICNWLSLFSYKNKVWIFLNLFLDKYIILDYVNILLFIWKFIYKLIYVIYIHVLERTLQFK